LPFLVKTDAAKLFAVLKRPASALLIVIDPIRPLAFVFDTMVTVLPWDEPEVGFTLQRLPVFSRIFRLRFTEHNIGSQAVIANTEP
jgi:hypothetical protein